MSEQRMYPGMGPEERTTFAPYSAFDIPADLRELHGRYDVEATARRFRNFRYAEEWMMMAFGGWMATVPEVPVKTGLAKVAWETAQTADEFGKRLPELRCGKRAVEASESSNKGFASFIEAVCEPERPDLTIEKLAGVFDVLFPHLIDVYERTARQTDAICDAPSIELLENAARLHRRHVAWGRDVLERLCDTDAKREARRARTAEIEEALQKSGGVTGELGA
ncbi:MAG: hypothetical protein JRH10_11870 [Deltaproteobacteria bacterium]|nr:hypothetical protein [Deltaproteobacteria bacterium]